MQTVPQTPKQKAEGCASKIIVLRRMFPAHGCGGLFDTGCELSCGIDSFAVADNQAPPDRHPFQSGVWPVRARIPVTIVLVPLTDRALFTSRPSAASICFGIAHAG